jgi:hypothetical protein
MQFQEQRQLLIVCRIIRVFNLFQQQLFHMSLKLNDHASSKK